MSRLDDYRAALLAAHSDIAADELGAALDEGGDAFVSFVIDHGLGPLWHERTGREEFRDSRLAAEALFLAHEQALREIGAALDGASIAHVVIKGAATRHLLYKNPALRACHDLDILVRPEDRVTAAETLLGLGFIPMPNPRNVSRELELMRNDAYVDLHWGLLREGRLRSDPTVDMLGQRRRSHGMWMLSPEDTLFVLLVHPAFAKHLAGWTMGLHRVADLLAWLRSQEFDWQGVYGTLKDNGVTTAGWATLRWTRLLSGDFAPPRLHELAEVLCPGSLRRSWLDFWLRNDLPARTSSMRWTRLLGFSMFLHDSAGDALRAASGRRRAVQRSEADLAEFESLSNK